MRDWVGAVSNYSLRHFYWLLQRCVENRVEIRPQDSLIVQFYTNPTHCHGLPQKGQYTGIEKDWKKLGTDQGAQTLGIHTIYTGKPEFPVGKSQARVRAIPFAKLQKTRVVI